MRKPLVLSPSISDRATFFNLTFLDRTHWNVGYKNSMYPTVGKHR